MPEERIGLHSIGRRAGPARRASASAGAQGSGFGKTAGRGQKGAGSRSGSKRKAGYEGGQIPLHMRMRKLRGPHMKKSMPFEPFRTHTQPVNLSDLNRFDDGAEVTPATLRERGLARRKRVPVKILAKGELERKNLTVSAHGFSAAAQAEDRGRRRDLHTGRGRAEGRQTMIATIANAFRVPEIRRKLLFTGFILALYRLGSYIPVPGHRRQTRSRTSRTPSAARTSSAFLNLFSGGGLQRLAIFALGIMPYITASIILQLMTVVVPTLEKLSEGRRGRPAEDHPVHALPDGRPRGGAVDRLRVLLPVDRRWRRGRDRHDHVRRSSS